MSGEAKWPDDDEPPEFLDWAKGCAAFMKSHGMATVGAAIEADPRAFRAVILDWRRRRGSVPARFW